ncbi:hypothetical protein OF83DRAFT_1179041 [Amylostereum chailletii]|nr:hypothetical protein OF83DRAFT_1179041 [Amylostereum chailletii]
MTNWRGTNSLLKDYGGAVNLIYATCGIVLWEIISTLTYEWTVLSRKRPYRWTIWHYTIVFLICAYVSVALGSFLVVLRVIAIWERNILVSVFSSLLWLTSIALNFREPFIVTSSWNTSVNACDLVVGNTFIVNVPMMVVSDILLLLLVLAGLVRKPEARGQGVFRFLYYQGIVWLVVATLAGVPSLVLVALDFNDPLDLLLQPILHRTLEIRRSICSTRMYRALADYGSVSVYSSGPGVSSPPRFRRRNTTPVVDVDAESATVVLDITRQTA